MLHILLRNNYSNIALYCRPIPNTGFPCCTDREKEREKESIVVHTNANIRTRKMSICL